MNQFPKQQFGTAGAMPPMLDRREDHLHLWKKGCQFLPGTYEQRPTHPYVERRILMNGTDNYCSICHCRKPPLFRMKALQPARDEYSDWNDEIAHAKNNQLHIDFQKISLEESAHDDEDVNGMQTTLKSLSHEYFTAFVETIDTDLNLAQIHLWRACQLDPYNRHLKSNTDSVIRTLSQDGIEIVQPEIYIRTIYDKIQRDIDLKESWMFRVAPGQIDYSKTQEYKGYYTPVGRLLTSTTFNRQKIRSEAQKSKTTVKKNMRRKTKCHKTTTCSIFLPKEKKIDSYIVPISVFNRAMKISERKKNII